MKENKNSKKNITIVCIIVLIVIISAIIIIIQKDKTKEIKEENVTNTKEVVYSVSSMTGNDLQEFDIAFLKLEYEGKNIVYSPLSIKYALAMLSAGANGNSKTQIENLIGEYQFYRYTNSNNMSFANALFIKNTMKNQIVDDYITTINNNYNAEVIYSDFSADEINNWVSQNTFKLVDNLVDDVSDNDIFLVNALAIDMDWKNKIQVTIDEHDKAYYVSYKHENYHDYIEEIYDESFDTLMFNGSFKAKAAEIGASINNYDIISDLGEENIRNTITKEYNEFLAEGGCGEDDLPTEEYVNKFIKELDSNYKQLSVSTDFNYYIDDEVKVFNKELKEYNGQTLEYIGIMPRDVSLEEYINNLTVDSLNQTISKIKEVSLETSTEGKITQIVGGIPFFKYDSELKLTEDLQALGVKDIFTSNADLSNLTSSNDLIINKTFHKSSIEFSNNGIRAAAASGEGGWGSTECAFSYSYEVPVEVIDMSFDKPYIYIIRDKETKEVWFIGAVEEPIQNDNEYASIITDRSQE